MGLRDRVVVVTGAAQGLGAAIAIAAADAGATVIGADLAPTSPDERVVMRELDVTDEAAVGCVRCLAPTRAWRLPWPRQQRRHHDARRLGEVSLEDWNRTLAINVTGRCSGCRH